LPGVAQLGSGRVNSVFPQPLPQSPTLNLNATKNSLEVWFCLLGLQFPLCLVLTVSRQHKTLADSAMLASGWLSTGAGRQVIRGSMAQALGARPEFLASPDTVNCLAWPHGAAFVIAKSCLSTKPGREAFVAGSSYEVQVW
jgi:hypothetical protein